MNFDVCWTAFTSSNMTLGYVLLVDVVLGSMCRRDDIALQVLECVSLCEMREECTLCPDLNQSILFLLSTWPWGQCSTDSSTLVLAILVEIRLYQSKYILICIELCRNIMGLLILLYVSECFIRCDDKHRYYLHVIVVGMLY